MDLIRKCRSLDSLTSKRNLNFIPNKPNANKSHHENEDERKNSIKIRSCLLSKTKSPIPKLKDLMTKIRNVEEQKDHIRTNIIRVKNKTKTQQRPKIVQDSCDGHRQDVDQAGLELKYVFKKEYGRTPQYLRRRRLSEQEKECTKEDFCNMRHVDEEEKRAVLSGLKNNLKEVEKRLLSLPVITDTLSKQRRKLYLENLLQKLEQDIEMLENNDIIVFKD